MCRSHDQSGQHQHNGCNGDLSHCNLLLQSPERLPGSAGASYQGARAHESTTASRPLSLIEARAFLRVFVGQRQPLDPAASSSEISSVRTLLVIFAPLRRWEVSWSW